MKTIILSIALLSISGITMANGLHNGRLTGMSGAGYATGGYADGVLYNPSLGAAYRDNDDLALVLNGGAGGSDEEDLIEGLEDLTDYLDYLNSITTYEDLDPDMAEEAIRLLQNVNAKTADVGASGSVVLAIPNRVISLALIGRSRVSASVTSLVDENDYQVIRDAVGEFDFDPDELNSSVLAKGAIITEVGVAFSRSLPTSDGTQLLVGVTPKRQTVETFIYSPTVSDFDEDNFDAAEYTVESSATNFDTGITYIDGNMRYALIVRDMVSREFETINPTETLTIESQTTAAVGYQNGWFTAEAALDLNAAPDFATGQDTRILRAGVEFNAWRWLQLRLGAKMDREDAVEDTYSAGVGISPFDTLNIDVSAFKGDNSTVGGAVQVGIRF